MAYRDVIIADSPRFYTRCDGNWNASANGAFCDLSGAGANYSFSSATWSTVAGLIAASGDTNAAVQSTSGGNRTAASGNNSTQTGNGAWSIECWVQFSANPGSNTSIVGFGNGTNAGIALTLLTTGHIQVDSTTTQLVNSTGVISTATPHYVCATYDGTTVSLYIDGLTANATATPSALTLASNQISFFEDSNGNRAVSGITMVIDEFAYYNTCLSLARVQAHYLAGRKPYGAGDYYKQQILAALYRGTTLTALGTSYIALYSAEPGDADASGTELTGSGYARVSVTNNTSNWNALTNSGTNTPYYTQNTNSVSFGSASGDWLYAGWFSVEDAASSSHRVVWGQLTAPVKVLNGQVGLFSANNLTAREA